MSLRKNVIANYLGQGWNTLMQLAFVPVYIKYLGIEAYGLIGIFALLQAWLSLLDVGMTPTLSREMARFSGGAHNAQSIRNLLRSIETIVLGIAIVIALGIWMGSDWLASNWLKAEKLPVATVAQAFTIMGMITALRFIENIYRSSIIGLQKQVLLNVVNSIMATLKGLGAVGILIWVSPTIEAFFLWQGIISVLTLGSCAYIVYHTLPTADHGGRFSLPALQGVWHYASGMVGITFLSLLLTQVDKIILSNLLTLKAFGYYSLAAMMASGLYTVVGPITQAFFPRFSELVVQKNQAELIRNYHKSAQLVTVIMGSAAIILMFFAETIIQLWTQDIALARNAATLVTLLALGNLLNGLMWIPYQTQLAYGWTGFAIKSNIIAVCCIIPAILWLTPLYGAKGAASVWVALNAGYVLIGNHFMYRKIIIGEKWRWYFQDVILPMSTAIIVTGLLSWVSPSLMSVIKIAIWGANIAIIVQIVWLIVISAIVLITSLLAASELQLHIKAFNK